MAVSSGSVVKDLPAMQETRVQSLGPEDPLEKGMATHSSILAWKITWTEKPGGLQSTGCKRFGDELATQQQWPYQIDRGNAADDFWHVSVFLCRLSQQRKNNERIDQCRGENSRLLLTHNSSHIWKQERAMIQWCKTWSQVMLAEKYFFVTMMFFDSF